MYDDEIVRIDEYGNIIGVDSSSDDFSSEELKIRSYIMKNYGIRRCRKCGISFSEGRNFIITANERRGVVGKVVSWLFSDKNYADVVEYLIYGKCSNCSCRFSFELSGNDVKELDRIFG
ncbi:MAG: hypothetical protein ACTSQE_13470 [Candidatus Heimdallarchaeaceae archaeon]